MKSSIAKEFGPTLPQVGFSCYNSYRLTLHGLFKRAEQTADSYLKGFWADVDCKVQTFFRQCYSSVSNHRQS